jgi:hypothetical protein
MSKLKDYMKKHAGTGLKYAMMTGLLLAIFNVAGIGDDVVGGLEKAASWVGKQAGSVLDNFFKMLDSIASKLFSPLGGVITKIGTYLIYGLAAVLSVFLSWKIFSFVVFRNRNKSKSE